MNKTASIIYCATRCPGLKTPETPDVNNQSANLSALSSHTPNPASTAVFLTPKSVSLISAASVPTSMNSLYAFTWSPTSTSNSPPRHSKPLVSAQTSMANFPFFTFPHNYKGIVVLILSFQVSRQSCRQRRIPSTCPRPPLPCRPHQQDVVMCRCR